RAHRPPATAPRSPRRPLSLLRLTPAVGELKPLPDVRKAGLAVPPGADVSAHARAGYVAALRAANASKQGPW
ncbi:MAG: hypothetical protein ACYCTZ_14850, partial [Candidatus Dormibacteria bacterium]